MTPQQRAAILAVESAAVAIDAARAALVEAARVLRASLDAAEPPAPVPAPEPPPSDPPADPPPDPPAPTPPAPPVQASLIYSMTHDDGSGPNRDHWSTFADIEWQTPGGDWLDANGTPQGAVPVAVAQVASLGPVSIDIPDVQRVRLGVLLLVQPAKVGFPKIVIAGRQTDTPPVLVVTRADGSQTALPCLSLPSWSTASTGTSNTLAKASCTSQSPTAAVFDIPADAVSGVLTLEVIERNSYTMTLHAMALHPPGLLLPRLHGLPLTGLAHEVASERDLASHPEVIRAGDFSDLRPLHEGGSVFNAVTLGQYAKREQIEDPTLPGGGVAYRGVIAAATGNDRTDALRRAGMSFYISTVRADTSDPLLPVDSVTDEMFARLYFMVEDDAGAADWRDAFKMGLGWDLRLGWWNTGRGGYWQNTTGNGGIRGTGLKVLRTNIDGTQQWEYQGHSIRMECGKGPVDPLHPWAKLRPLQSYTYHLDQFDFNGQLFRAGRGMIELGRWHCLEQRLKLNSIEGPFDDIGNGQAVPDGVLETWLDGVHLGARTGLRFKRHPELGIEGPWCNVMFGGKKPPIAPLGFRIGNVAVARRYIGPARG